MTTERAADMQARARNELTADDFSRPHASQMGMDLRVARSVIEDIRGHAAAALPHECCGILLGQQGEVVRAVPTVNIAPEPMTHFEIDSQALIDAHRFDRSGGQQVVGYYHSHPNGLAEPSETDRAQASRDGRVWAIAGSNGIAFWRDGERGFERLSCESFDG